LPVPRADPSAFIFVMVFALPLMQHIVFFLLIELFLSGKSKKPKSCPDAQSKNTRQK